MSVLLELWPQWLMISISGIAAGLLAGLFGIGGGLIIVPVLFYLLQNFGVSAQSAMSIATATSLITIIPTSIASSRAHLTHNTIDFSIVRWWGPFILIASATACYGALHLNGQWITRLFALLILIVGIRLLWTTGSRGKPRTVRTHSISKGWQALMAMTMGAISVILGIGGGTIGVPLLTYLKLTSHRAIGTCSVLGLMIALPGAVTLFVFGLSPVDAPLGTWKRIYWPAVILLLPITLTFAPLGVRLGSKLPQRRLTQLFAVFLILTSARMAIPMTE